MKSSWSGDRALVSGYIYGVRAWDVRAWKLAQFFPHPTGCTKGLLYPLIAHNSGDYWLPGVNTASCYMRSGSGVFNLSSQTKAKYGRVHESERYLSACVDRYCLCGYYASFKPENIPHLTSNQVYGVIRGSGKVTAGSLGFRCEKAEIIGLIRPRPKGLQLVTEKWSTPLLPPIEKPLIESITETYPDVPWFSSFKAAMKGHYFGPPARLEKRS